MKDLKIVRLNIFTDGYGIHTQSDNIIQFATEPTMVELTFSGENNIQRKYSRQCATDASDEVAVEYLTHLLKTHDWYYNYSDDNRVWRNGQQHSQLIQWTILQLQDRGIDAAALYEQYSPFTKAHA